MAAPTFQMAQRIMAMAYGQSPSIGVGGSPAYAEAQPFGNIQFAGDVRGPGVELTNLNMLATEPLIERTSPQSGYGQTGVFRACNSFVREWQKLTGNAYPNQDFILHGAAGGRSGMPMSSLSKGSPYYNDMQSMIAAGYDRAEEAQKSFATGFFMFDHGEADTDMRTSRQTYRTQGLTMMRDATLDAMQRGKQIFRPFWLACQTSSWKRYYLNNGGISSIRPEIALAQRDMAHQSPDWKTIMPKYGFVHGSDRIHFPNYSYDFRGFYYGRAAARTMFARIHGLADPVVALDFIGDVWQGDVWQGDVWQGWFDVPDPPLEWDVTDITAVPNYGFDLWAPDGVTRLDYIQDIILVPKTNSVVAKFSETPPTGSRMTAAFGRSETGSGPTDGPRCQLRDSAGYADEYIDPRGITMRPHHRVLHFETIKPDPAIAAGSMLQ